MQKLALKILLRVLHPILSSYGCFKQIENKEVANNYLSGRPPQINN